MKKYTEEFYWVNLRASYMEDTLEKTERSVNGLRLEILDEISILSPRNIEEAYQSALKAEKDMRGCAVVRAGSGNTFRCER